MKTITRTYNVLEAEDLERAVSEYFGKEITLSEMEVDVCDCIHPWDDDFEKYYDPSTEALGMCITVEGAENAEGYDFVSEFEIGLADFFREKDLFIDDKYIFGFDTGLFKSYSRYVSTDD